MGAPLSADPLDRQRNHTHTMPAVLFDFDFTLADSTVGTLECTNHALRKLGLPLVSTDEVRPTIGLSLASAFQRLTGHHDATLAHAFSRHFVARADQVMAALIEVDAPVRPVLTKLRGLGCRLAIVSTKFRYRITDILARHGLADLFEEIVGGEDVLDQKPNPSALILALTRLSVTPEQALYVGDHPVDAEAAAAAGVRFVACLTGPSTPSDFGNREVLAFLPDLRGVPAVVSRIFFSRHGAV